MIHIVVAGLIIRERNILICQRAEHSPFPLKWEFPGGKVEPNETHSEALSRELHEELRILAEIGTHVATIRHSYGPAKEFEVHFYLVETFTGKPHNQIFNDVRWVPVTELPDYDFLEADVYVLRQIASGQIG